MMTVGTSNTVTKHKRKADQDHWTVPQHVTTVVPTSISPTTTTTSGTRVPTSTTATSALLVGTGSAHREQPTTQQEWNDVSASWKECQERLAVLQLEFEERDDRYGMESESKEDNHGSDCENDPILADLMKYLSIHAVDTGSNSKGSERSTVVQSIHHALEEEAAAIERKLQYAIDQAAAKCQQDSARRIQLQRTYQEQLSSLDQYQISLHEEQQQQLALQQAIVMYQEELAQTQDLVRDLQWRGNEKATRLRNQISLYAQCTGIKWDYSNHYIPTPQTNRHDDNVPSTSNDRHYLHPNSDEILDSTDGRPDRLIEGEVSVPLLSSIVRFSLDTTEYSPFEIAQQLWSLMEYGTVHPPVHSSRRNTPRTHGGSVRYKCRGGLGAVEEIDAYYDAAAEH